MSDDRNPTPWIVNDPNNVLASRGDSSFRPISIFDAYGSEVVLVGRTVIALPIAERIITAVNTRDALITALRSWFCPGCGGKGTYQQDAKGRVRKAEQGKPHDPRYQPDAVTCRVCNGNRLHPTASAALAAAGVSP